MFRGELFLRNRMRCRESARPGAHLASHDKATADVPRYRPGHVV